MIHQYVRPGAVMLLTAGLLTMLPAGVAVQTPETPPSTVGAVVQMEPSQAARIARESRAAATIQVADGLVINVWATGHLVADALAIDLDANGVAFVAASPRSGQLLDTRSHPDWVPELHALKTTEDLRRFFRRKMAPSLSAVNTWLPDENRDGSRDWRDLMVVKERIYRIEDTDGDGVADKSVLAYAGFNEDVAADIAGGVLVHDRDLYVAMAPDIWRLRDTNGDGVFDQKTSISHGYSVHPSFSGHDLSALTTGPDGRIYWKVGEIGMNVVDQTGRRWAHPHTGAVLRSNPDGSDFEVFASGVRNPQEIAFDDYGNLVSVDNDGDYPGETERVIYIAEGGETGWRSNWQYGKYTDPNNNHYNVWIDEGLSKVRFDGQAAYITPPVAPYAAGPSGFAYNPGTALDARWRGHFFVTSFTGSSTNARVFAFKLNPLGAGFEMGTNTQIVQGVLSPGMRVGPDGAIYLTDWIRGWGASGEGRVWKLDSIAGAKSPIRMQVATLLKSDFTARSAAGLRGLLRHDDQRIRLKAQFELVRRGDRAHFIAEAADPGHQLGRIHALWGLGQLLRKGSVTSAALTTHLADRDPEIRAQAIRMVGDARSTAAVPLLLPLLADPSPRVRFFAAQALGRAKARAATAPIVAMLAANDDADVYLRQAGVVALANIGDRTALAALASHSSRGVRLAAVVALRRLRDPAVARFLDDRDVLVVTEAARATNDEGGIPSALPMLARVIDRPGLTSEPLLRRALSANLRGGTAEGVGRVAAFAGRAGVSEALRVEAIAILGVWAAPSNLDRVDGHFLGVQTGRDGAAAQAAVVSMAGLLTTAGTTPAVKIALVEAAAKIGAKTLGPALLSRLQTDADAPVRVAALRALTALGVPETAIGARAALADTDASVRMAAITAMATMPIAPAAKVEHLVSVVANGTVGEQQSAIEALGRVKAAEATEALNRLADRLAAGAIPAVIQLDVLDALRVSGASTLHTRLDQLRVGRMLENLAGAFPAALTTGGSAARGRQLAQQHPAAQCTRCHTLGTATATVGPSLNGIGAQLSREDLLRSLIEPSARVAPGFGQVSVTLKNGQKVDGVLREETDVVLVLELPTGATTRISKSEVATRSNAVSAMPPMGALLQPREIRDVVEFLAGLK